MRFVIHLWAPDGRKRVLGKEFFACQPPSEGFDGPGARLHSALREISALLFDDKAPQVVGTEVNGPDDAPQVPQKQPQ